jgi:anaerobic magnesium-protoporphyrin IX monomethyl ester cyclase
VAAAAITDAHAGSPPYKPPARHETDRARVGPEQIPRLSSEPRLTYLYKHALCLHPYYRDSHSGSLGLAVFPPIGLEYVAAALRPHVETLSLVDLRMPGRLRDLDSLRGFIKDNVDLLCVSINWEYDFDKVCALVNSLPREITTVVGGQQATLFPEEILAECPGVDILVRGEGEETIAEIATGKPLGDVLGISYRDNGIVIHNAIRPFGDIEDYTFPDRSLRPNKYHFNVGGFALRGEEFDMALTARGCPYNCKFCTFNINPWTQKRRYSARSVDSIMEELRQVTAGIVLFTDENFFVNPRRAKEICERIVEEGIDKRFLVQARIEIFEHEDVLQAAEKAGIKIMLLGIESPTDRILEQLHKGFDTAKLRLAFETFRKYSFLYHGYFIYGNVGETEQEMLQIPVFADELGLDSITYQKLRIEKYSPLKELVESTPGYFIGDDNIVYQEGLGRPFLKRIAKQITKEFYTPARLLKICQKLFSIGVFKPNSVLPMLLSLPVLAAYTVGRKVNKQLKRSAIYKHFVSLLGW